MSYAGFKILNVFNNSPVFWVVLSLFIVSLPHLSRFPAWSVVLIIILFLWRLICIKHKNWLPPRWILVVISLSTFAAIFISFGTLIGKTAGSVLLVILLAVKLHESQSKRDYMLIISLSFFVIITNFLFSQSIPVVLFMLFAVIILVISMLSINQGDAQLSLNYKFKFSLKLLFQALPLMLVMFILFPRISGPLWQLPEDSQSAITGLSDTMSPGNISNLIQSNAVAFRVKFDDTVPQQNKLYWRALVLWYFDGRTWEQGKHNPTPLATLQTTTNENIHYTVTLEAHHRKWLYALDIPSNVPADIIYTSNYNLRSQQTINNLYQYKISSVLEYFNTSEISPWEKSAGLKIPLNSNPETLRMGKNLALQFQNKEDIVNYVLQYFNQEDFHYTLRPPLTPGFNSVDQFLFETKRGFCEHYASSFTLLMRAAGIPARIVLGFQGGTNNPLNNIMTVSNSDAHAWSEVWFKNRGWVRIDPTAAVAPQRIEQNLNAALDQAETRPLHMQINSSFLKDVLFYWDAMDNQWNLWVIGYDEKFQQKLLENIFNKKFELSEIIIIMICCLAVLLLVLAMFILKPWQKQKLEPEVKIYNDFCNKLASRGLIRAPHEGPLDFANRAKMALPEKAQTIEQITRLFTALRFEKSHHKQQYNELRDQVRRFKIAKR
ncbi:MAG: DUF3488 and transglutaminase-like domain-containing protein [Gammaproteobacteria bacterium]|nr:DUF3488 and transglutaminase-like domain-containing protein [Gammaproteobacteria bacterium]